MVIGHAAREQPYLSLLELQAFRSVVFVAEIKERKKERRGRRRGEEENTKVLVC